MGGLIFVIIICILALWILAASIRIDPNASIGISTIASIIEIAPFFFLVKN